MRHEANGPETDLKTWSARPRPDGRTLHGRFVRLEKLDATRHGPALAETLSGPGTAPLYDFLFETAPTGPADVLEWVVKAAQSADPYFYAVVDRATGRAVGRLALMRIEPAHGVIEVGSILFGPALQRTAGGTEAIALLADHVFADLGYRRFEWKCHNANAPSKRAAARYGFTFEGVFRQHMVLKGANRDTAWFAMLDTEWPVHRRAFDSWLDAANFSADGRQLRRLEEFR